MDIFTPKVPEKKYHPHFKNALLSHCAPQRSVLNQWADGFVDRDHKFITQFQTSFNSCFWELYLHACIKSFGFNIDWNHDCPDFILNKNNYALVIEATTANASQGKPNEWECQYAPEELKNINFPSLNKEAIIRLANAICTKSKTYCERYSTLPHVKGKPFIIAVAPFDQPYFNMQLDRAITALLFDHYVDEEEFKNNASQYPNGPPVINLGSVEKDNGSEIVLGLFNDNTFKHVSAIMHSCSATWGKLDALCPYQKGTSIIFQTLTATEPYGEPAYSAKKKEEYSESLVDGLHIFHNPFAEYPLDPDVFRKQGVVQHYLDNATNTWIHENMNNRLIWRMCYRLVADAVKRSSANEL